MSRPPGTLVTSTTTQVPRGAPTDTGVAFVTGQFARGAVGTAVQVNSMGDVVSLLGGRTAQSALAYDALDSAFREGLVKAYAGRVVGATPVAATHQFSDRGGTPHPTVSATAKSVGADGNLITVAFANGTDANTVIATVKYNSVVQEISPELTSVADIVAWQSAWVTFADLASSNVAPSNLPAVITDTALTGGDDDFTNVTETQWTAALASFPVTLGPGQVAAPGRTTTAAYLALLGHAAANNRFAVLDAADTNVIPTLTAAAAALGSPNGSYGGLWAPWEKIPGVTTSAATRTSPPSGLLLGMFARTDASNDADTVPMGQENGSSTYALDVSQTFSDADRATLNDADVNILINPYGTVMNYGLRTLDSSEVYQQVGNARLRMAIVAQAGAVGDRYVGTKITPANIVAFQGELIAMLTGFYASGALDGASPSDAFAVDVGPSVNTTASIAAGHLKAVLSVRMTESAEFVDIEIVKIPLTQSLAAA